MENKGRLFLLPCILFLIVCSGCVSHEIKALGTQMLMNLAFVVPFVTGMVLIIFLMNKFIVNKDGETNERACSIIGAILFPLIFAAVLWLKFGFGWVTAVVSLVLGGITGWFSYTLDELMETFWENKKVTVPAALGLMIGGWMFVNVFTHVWLQGDMYVTHKACARRVVIERYTYHYSTDSKGNSNSYYSWDYHSSAERFSSGTSPPILIEGKDYRLGTGALGKKDRVGREEIYQFIGGNIFSEERDQWTAFRWLSLANPKLRFKVGVVQTVQSNFYGNPINNGGEVKGYSNLPNSLKNVALPSMDDLPPASGMVKVVSMSYNFLKLLITEKEYRSLLYMHIAGAFLLGILALIPGMRTSVLTFIVCSSIVILVILLAVAARTGSIPGLGDIGRRRTGGGGGFGGRSISM